MERLPEAVFYVAVLALVVCLAALSGLAWWTVLAAGAFVALLAAVFLRLG